jgi:hypothetical protein
MQDLAKLQVYGKLKTWLDAWSAFVHQVGSALFGWIDLGWIRVPAEEHHVLVIAALLTLAAGRATYIWIKEAQVPVPSGPRPEGDETDFRVQAKIVAWQKERDDYPSKVASLNAAKRTLPPFIPLYFLLPLGLALLIPGSGGLGWSAASVFLLAFFGLLVVEGPKVWEELLGIGAVFLLVVAVNYSWLRGADA